MEEVRSRYFIQTEDVDHDPVFGMRNVVAKGVYELTDEEVGNIEGRVTMFVQLR